MAVHKIKITAFLYDLHRIIARIAVYAGYTVVLRTEISFFGLRISFAEKVYITVVEICLRSRFLSMEFSGPVMVSKSQQFVEHMIFPVWRSM